jgi:putative membrane protein
MKFRSFVAVMLLAGCASSPGSGNLTDRQIAMVMRVMNLSEVREGEIARDKSGNATVREFAQMMINEHDAQNNKAEAELARADINSEDTTMSRQLDASSGAAADRLRGLTGAALERAFIDREVEAHQSALNLIDSSLIPNARKKVVKDQLTALRNLVESHLTRAKQIQASLTHA